MCRVMAEDSTLYAALDRLDPTTLGELQEMAEQDDPSALFTAPPSPDGPDARPGGDEVLGADEHPAVSRYP